MEYYTTDPGLFKPEMGLRIPGICGKKFPNKNILCSFSRKCTDFYT